MFLTFETSIPTRFETLLLNPHHLNDFAPYMPLLLIHKRRILWSLYVQFHAYLVFLLPP